MIEIISGQSKFVRMCETCGSVVSYVYTDLRIKKVRDTIRPSFQAFRCIECPVCKHDIRH